MTEDGVYHKMSTFNELFFMMYHASHCCMCQPIITMQYKLRTRSARYFLTKRSKTICIFDGIYCNYNPICSCLTIFSWWRHQMKTFYALLAICAGNSPVPGEFPAQRPVTRSFDIFFDLRLNKRLSKQSWGWWFETPSRPLWRHRNATSMTWQGFMIYIYLCSIICVFVPFV